MNNQIKELAEQAEAHYRANVLGASMYRTPPAKLMEYFAELIVRECIGIVSDSVDHREPASTYVGKIKEHFGIEE